MTEGNDNEDSSTTTTYQINENKRKERTPKKDKVKALTKVIIRKLPPTMTEETFLKQIEPLPDHESYYFVPADWSLGKNSTSRAYINFINQDDIFLFKDRFDGYVFIDNSTGSEYPAIVEFAPFQGLLKVKCRKKDPKCNTIETDPHYINFLKKHQNEINKASSLIDFKLEFPFSNKNDKKITSTPLLQYLANKKQDKKDDRKRRNEQKRRQRDEERKRKRAQVIKAVPPSIREEESKEIKKEKSMTTDNKRDMRGKRKLERDQRRRQEREQERSERVHSNGKKQDQRKNSTENVKASNLIKHLDENENYELKDKKDNLNSNGGSKEDKLTVGNMGCYEQNTDSNSRKKHVEKNSKNEEINENVREFILNASSSIKNFTTIKNESIGNIDGNTNRMSLDKRENTSKGTGNDSKKNPHRNKSDEINKEGKNSRRIRNKDRPSIEIYQPGKMRLSSKKDENRANSSESRDNKFCGSLSDNDNVRKEQVNKNVVTTNNIDTDTTQVRKKVSRYSERRLNHAREREEKASKLNAEYANAALLEAPVDQA